MKGIGRAEKNKDREHSYFQTEIYISESLKKIIEMEMDL
jgi:hypothetical protein